MTFALSICLLASIEFFPEEISGLRAEAVHPLTGAVSLNCIQADLDGDGAVDLAFGHEVAFQRGGRFPREARVPLPSIEGQPILEVWAGAVYLMYPGSLAVYQWRDNRWETVLTQPAQWPSTDMTAGMLPLRGQARSALLQRRLHDLDGDGAPEIVAMSPDGAHLFRRDGAQYVSAGVLNVLPQLTLLSGPPAQVWPPESRRVVFPPREMACRLVFEADRLRVLTRVSVSDDLVRYQERQYRVQLTPEGVFAATPAVPEAETTADLPSYVQPCRLNADETMDYAGGRWEMGRGSLLPFPTYTTYATLDGGVSSTVRRSRTFRPYCSFVDFDGDGDLDMVTESSGPLSGGPREGLLRFLTSIVIQHEFAVYRQVQGAFAESPAPVCRIAIQAGQPPFVGNAMFQRYQRAALVNLSGDLNNDGYKDLVVQDRPDRLAVFLAAGYDFPDAPSCVIPFEFEATFAVADVNLDGYADVILRAVPAERGGEPCRVYFAAEALP